MNDTGLTLEDLFRVNQDEYKRLKNPGYETKIPGFEMIAYSFDKQSHHGATAFYNEQNGTLLIAHKGSVTTKDWLRTDVAIAFNAKETQADKAAVEFAKKMLRNFKRQGKDITKVIETGHSKGGRESQMVTYYLSKEKTLPCYSLTFNSATISSRFQKAEQKINHVNLRGKGTGFFKFLKTDIVSSFREHLGDNVNFNNKSIKGPVSAHSINSFEKGLKDYPYTSKMNVIDFIDECKAGKNIEQIEAHLKNNDKNISNNDFYMHTNNTSHKEHQNEQIQEIQINTPIVHDTMNSRDAKENIAGPHQASKQQENTILFKLLGQDGLKELDKKIGQREQQNQAQQKSKDPGAEK